MAPQFLIYALSVSALEKTYAGRTLFSDVGFSIIRGDRIGLADPMVRASPPCSPSFWGETTPDSGRVMWEKGATIGFLPQESAPVGDESVLSLALSHVPETPRWEAEPKAKRSCAAWPSAKATSSAARRRSRVAG